jgi:hypothetical protein
MNSAKPSDWNTQPLPDARETISLDRIFTAEEIDRIQQGLIPEEMEDKWFIYWQDDTLYFHRSWTGFCIYVVRFQRDGDFWRMIEADVNRDPDQYQGDDEDRERAMISYLIDLLLLRRVAEYPADDPSSDESAVENWGIVGLAMLDDDLDDDDDLDIL